MARQKNQPELQQDELKQGPQTEQVTENTEEQQEPEKLSRWEAAHKAIAEIDGDTTYSDIIERANELFVAGGGEADDDRMWNEIDKAMTHLQELGLVDCEWEVRVHPNVTQFGLPSKNGK